MVTIHLFIYYTVVAVNISLTGAQVIDGNGVITSKPIFLDQLYCTDNDEALQDCRRGIVGLGLTTCSHHEDVWVRCLGGFRNYLLIISWITPSMF